MGWLEIVIVFEHVLVSEHKHEFETSVEILDTESNQEYFVVALPYG